ncbi:MAG: cytosine permease [Armatimonadota bacterium]|nr:cytosine permease [Armatimonadota bacterium]MDR5696214.1 cytosine permease [Armatimonadota bacterium]
MAQEAVALQPAARDPDYPLEHVPVEARKGLVSVTAVLVGFTFFSGTMFAGAQLGAAYPFGQLLLVLLIGNLLLGLYVATLAGIAARSGLTTVLLSRYTLGRYGAKWADLLLGGTQVGWFGVTVAFMAVPFVRALNLPESWTAPMMILWGTLHAATAYFGYRGMEKLSYIGVPLMTILGFWSMAIALRDGGGLASIAAKTPTETMTLAAAMTVIVGSFASGGTQAPNWGRFARTPTIAFTAALTAFMVANGLMFLFGAIGGAVYQKPDLADVLAAQGLLLWGVLFLALNLWTTNDNAAYAFGVAGAEAFNVNNKRPFILIGAVIGTIFALTGAYNLLIPWMIAMGTFIPPLGGVIIADYLFVWKRRLPRMEYVTFVPVRWTAVIAYVLGGLAAKYLPGIPPVNGVVVAMVAHLVLQGLFAARLGSEHEVDPRAEYV